MPSRRQLRSLTNLGLFVTLLCTILYLNSPSPPSKTFAWNTVRYQTRTPPHQLPESRGICPGLSRSGKPALVVNHVSSDGSTAWLSSSSLKEKYHLCIYEVDSPPTNRGGGGGGKDDDDEFLLRVPANRGHESMSYLTFLIDNYGSIPSAGAVFIHGARYAWHNDHASYDNLALLRDLDVAAALAPHGYHNLRCDWSLGTCDAAAAQGSLATAFQAATSPWDKRAVSDAAFPGALTQIFGGGGGGEATRLGRADAVRSQCCAQFVVSRSKVHTHSRAEYFALRQWLLDGSSSRSLSSSSSSSSSQHHSKKEKKHTAAAPADDRVAGRILSYVWHILFLRGEEEGAAGEEGGGGGGGSDLNLSTLNAQACPSAGECYCRLYGRCGLSCPQAGTCEGQYTLPPNLKVDQQGRSGPELKS